MVHSQILILTLDLKLLKLTEYIYKYIHTHLYIYILKESCRNAQLPELPVSLFLPTYLLPIVTLFFFFFFLHLTKVSDVKMIS